MTPSVESLATLLHAFDCAMLTVVDADGHPRTRPLRPLQAPFNGHLWFKIGPDAAPTADIGRGAEVSIAYGGGSDGPFVTVYGWAMVLRNPAHVRSVWRAAAARDAPDRNAVDQLICVSARAAEVWDAASSASRRTFAFSNAHPVCQQEPAPPQRAFAPRLVVGSAISCIS